MTTHSSNLVHLCLPVGGKVIFFKMICHNCPLPVNGDQTGFTKLYLNLVKTNLSFLAFYRGSELYFFYVENHLTECNGSFYRRIFYQHQLTSLTLENSCMDRSWGKRTNLELSKSSGKLFCFRIRILELDITIHECLNIWITVHNEFLEGKTRKMSKMAKLTIGELLNVNPVNSLLKAFIGDFE